MILIVSLGNPGQKYQKTRHNVGFMALDEFQKIHGFSDWQLKKKFKAEISEGIMDGKKIILAKPQTFMNESGKAVKIIINNLSLIKLTRTFLVNLLVVHDDLDLPLGKMKIVQNRGSAGHKGVQSIIDELGTKNFVRFRIGIKNQEYRIQNTEKPSTRAKLGAGLVPHRNKVSGAGFVLQKFSKEESKILKEVIEKTYQAIEMAAKQGIEKAMAEFNQ